MPKEKEETYREVPISGDFVVTSQDTQNEETISKGF